MSLEEAVLELWRMSSCARWRQPKQPGGAATAHHRLETIWRLSSTLFSGARWWCGTSVPILQPSSFCRDALRRKVVVPTVSKLAVAVEPESVMELGRFWQQRVAHLLLDLAYDPGEFVIRRVDRARQALVPRFGHLAAAASCRRQVP